MVDSGLVQVAPLGLEIRAFVPVQAQPQHGSLNAFGVLRPVPEGVGVLDPQHEGPALLAGEQPVEQRGPSAADMEVAGRRRCHPDTDGAHRVKVSVVEPWTEVLIGRSLPTFALGPCERHSPAKSRGQVLQKSRCRGQLASRSRASLPASARRSLVSASRSIRRTRSAVRSRSSPTSPWVLGSPRSRP